MTDEPRIPGLTTADSRWLIQECQRVLTDLGHSSTVTDGPALTLEDQRVMGLDNLARTVRMAPRKRWPRLVRDQLRALVAIDPTEPIAPEDLRVKLVPREVADPLLTYDAIEPLPGLVAMLATQGDQVNTQLGTLDQVGGDREAAYDRALTNMDALPLPRHSRRRVDPHDPGSWVEFLDADDSFGASRVAVLPELLRRVLGQGIPSCGVLVAVPTRREIWLHLPVDEGVIDTAAHLAHAAYEVCALEPYALSPDVYLVSPDMRAEVLIRPDRLGFDLTRGAALALLDAVLDEDADAG